jgi:glutamyl-Q tRNA(Asp) synthetase
MAWRTRFAPSPTGPLHLGHAFSALAAWDRAEAAGGTFLLRIEDIDTARCRPEWEAAIADDLRWLGLDWPEPVMRQSTRGPAYRAALDRLAALGVLYPCRCRRTDIRAALSAPQEGAAPAFGPDGPVYPGTCRGRPMAEAGPQDALRLDMARALSLTGPVSFRENGPLHRGVHTIEGDAMIRAIGDVVLARRDIGTAYHLAVVVDDAAQAITEIVRGADLFEATPIHILLQRLLEQPLPTYWHHDLVRDENGKRLAKRDDARALSLYRAGGATPADIRRLVGLG